MSRVPTELITRERLDGWAQKLAQEEGTPLLLLGIGHNSKQGALIICTVDEPMVTYSALAEFLRAAADKIENCTRTN